MAGLIVKHRLIRSFGDITWHITQLIKGDGLILHPQIEITSIIAEAWLSGLHRERMNNTWGVDFSHITQQRNRAGAQPV
jgi:hypothetical protein